MPKFFIEELGTTFQFCSGLDPIEGAYQLIHLIQAVGGGFLKIGRRQAEPDPFTWIDAKGNLHIAIEHNLLQPETLTYQQRNKGSAWLSFGRETMFVLLGQSVAFPDLSKVDPVAHGQLAFARLLYPYLRPKYGWIDEPSGNEPTSKDIAATTLQYIFWANFFGPDYVARYGRDFLLNAPGWKIEELDDGGILYVTTESYVEWWSTYQTEHMEREELIEWASAHMEWWAVIRPEIVRYFRAKIPDIRLYRAEVELD